jgi:hypothetical protein
MDLNIINAIIGGLIATVAMTILMVVAPMMGMPKMDMPGLLGSMFGAPGNRMMGLVMHLMMGTIFGIVYAVLFSIVGGSVVFGVVFGVVHWLITGTMMGMMPMMHAGIKSGDVQAPGMFMSNVGGMIAFMGGLMGHVVFGLAFAIVYTILAG